ncbi:MAG: global cell cycle regulator GcrA-like protein [SAR116 cluster bacterium]|nr:global cell cycle regulator GcrA-like protein [SAR116 cluster bacterium]RPH08422.1 MAG: global cell cycle regulator GcrA-like protein [Alphaproteobacteria bacterium TMED54]|tara:strand:- start:1051 stop:1449 length:399 start_codon:yes stop_codon:yes gene_type:complete
MSSNNTWDDLKLKKLQDLWKQGLPISKIGEMLGVSRNSIAGKAHRMGLPKRNSPISSDDKSSLQKRKDEVVDENIPLKIKLRSVQWSRTKCCWPEGDPKQKNFKFCGKDIYPGRPYCDKHSLLAYTNTRENS